MLKDLVDFINIMFLIIAPPLGVFGICVGIYSFFQELKDIKKIDQEKVEEKICLKK